MTSLHLFAVCVCWYFVWFFIPVWRGQSVTNSRMKESKATSTCNTQGKFSLSLVAYSKEHSDSSVWPETTQFSRQPGCSCEQRCYCSFQSYHIASCTYSLLIIAPVDCWRTSTLEENGKCDSYAHWLQHVEQHKQPTKTTTECVLTATVALNSCLHCGNDAS